MEYLTYLIFLIVGVLAGGWFVSRMFRKALRNEAARAASLTEDDKILRANDLLNQARAKVGRPPVENETTLQLENLATLLWLFKERHGEDGYGVFNNKVHVHPDLLEMLRPHPSAIELLRVVALDEALTRE